MPTPAEPGLLLIEMSDSHLTDCVGLTLGIVEKVATGNGVESTRDILNLIAICAAVSVGRTGVTMEEVDSEGSAVYFVPITLSFFNCLTSVLAYPFANFPKSLE